MPRIILHIDLDAFYASAEKARNPELIGKPVVIGADPRGGKGRGVVAACSYEARKFGIRSGMPISRAYKLSPDAVYLRPDFAYYNHLSSEIMDLFRKFASRLEQASVDEAYLDVSDRVSSYGNVESYVKSIKEALKENFSLTCSVGAAVNKSIAKIASDIKKPDGITIVRPEDSKEFLAPLPVGKISGVGAKTEEVLEEMGIKTIGELANADGKELVKVFGKNGVWLWGIANAIERVEVEEILERKSISHEFTFQKDTADENLIRKTVDDLIAKVHNRLVDDNLICKTVGIKIRYENFATFIREKGAADYTDSKNTISSIAYSLFNEFKNNKKVRLLGVRLSNLKPMEDKQQSLSAWQK